MRMLSKTTGIIALSASLAAFAAAVPIQGSIEINLDESSFSFDANTLSFEQPSSGVVNDADGDLGGHIGSSVEYKDLTYTALPAGGIADLWTITGANVSFSLSDLLFVDYQTVGNNQFLTLLGAGWLHAEGMDDTAASWSFSADANGGVYNYSSTTVNDTPAVPESGASIAMLGAGLICLGLASRLRMRKA